MIERWFKSFWNWFAYRPTSKVTRLDKGGQRTSPSKILFTFFFLLLTYCTPKCNTSKYIEDGCKNVLGWWEKIRNRVDRLTFKLETRGMKSLRIGKVIDRRMNGVGMLLLSSVRYVRFIYGGNTMIVSRNRDNGTFTIKISLEEWRNYQVQDRLRLKFINVKREKNCW